jgi:putative peptidoglycan lipid II flippase
VVALRILLQIGLFVVFAAEFTAAGLMLGNAVSYVVAAVATAWLLRIRVGRIGLGDVSVTFGKVLLASLGAALVGLIVVKLLPGDTPPTRPESILQLVVGGGVIGATYVGLALALRLPEMNDVLGMVRRRLGR